MTTRTTESHIEAEQLRQRIAWLADENRTLRELADPSAGTVRLQAENILLQREADMLADLVPSLAPYTGPLPDTLDGLNALPGPHRRQIRREHPEHVLKLRQVEQLMNQAAQRDDAAPNKPTMRGYL